MLNRDDIVMQSLNKLRNSPKKKEKEKDPVGLLRGRAPWPINSVLGDLAKIAVEKLKKSQILDKENALSIVGENFSINNNLKSPYKEQNANKLNYHRNKTGEKLVKTKNHFFLKKFIDNKMIIKIVRHYLMKNLQIKNIKATFKFETRNCYHAIKNDLTNDELAIKILTDRIVNNNMSKSFQLKNVVECRDVECFEITGKIDEGTFGLVFRAIDRSSGYQFALKKVKLIDKNCQSGYPKNSIREINLMLSLQHPNIVNVFEITIGSTIDKVYIVSELMDHDLKSLMETIGQRYFTVSEVKNIMIQLLTGLAYLHENDVLHRDIKTSNILYNNNGEIKLCDFGISRCFIKTDEHYTPTVVTPYYRSPELFLGEDKYSAEIDLWSCGCIMGELLTKKPMFIGDGEVEILNEIFYVMGTPTEVKWPGWTKLKNYKTYKFSSDAKCKLRSIFPAHYFDSRPVLSHNGIDLFERLLCLNPKNRISASEALQHPWFQENPHPKSNSDMPNYPSTAALDYKLRHWVRQADPLERVILLHNSP